MCGHGKRYGSEISVCIQYEDQELFLFVNPLKAQVREEDGIAEHTLGGSATCVIPTHIEGGISNLVRLLVMRGKFEELSLCETHMVELTFFGPAYEGV